MTEEQSYRTTSATPPAKAELLAALRESGDEFLSRLRAVPTEAFEEGRYENGWNGRQILAHVASIEWTYANLLDIARNAEIAPKTEEGLPTRPAQGGIDSYNERQVAKREGVPATELLDEFARNRAKTIAAIEAADEALLAVPIRSGGGIPGPLGSVLNAVAVGHIRTHLQDILGESQL